MTFRRELLSGGLLALYLSSSVCAQTAAPEATTTPEAPTAVSDCHPHGATQYCVAGTEEYEIIMEATPTGELPSQYTDCHPHGEDIYCFGPDGDTEVQIVLEGAEESSDEHNHDEHSDEQAGEQTAEENCHFHAGVEHCVGAGEAEGDAEGEPICEKVDRDYNIPLRIGLLFVIMVTSAIGVYAPIFIEKFKVPLKEDVLLIIKQFGTGVIISTAFIHLYTHAYLMFSNRCLGALEYEGTTSAIVMAGIIISFFIDYLSHRFVRWRKNSNPPEDAQSIEAPSQNSDAKNVSPGHTPNLPSNHGHLHEAWGTDALTVASLEAGILFHSILIGLTLVVAGDSVFLTLFAVILFHQMFEGLALGSMIAQVPTKALAMWKKYLMALAFTLITPIGMAIGIGILDHFNGNDKSTIVAIGTLDAFSSGILVWVGLVEMLAKDWMEGPLINTGVIKTTLSGLALISGLVVMSVLGKWA